MILNIPNLITLSRIVLIPLLIGIYYLPSDWLTDGNKDVTATVIGSNDQPLREVRGKLELDKVKVALAGAPELSVQLR